MDSKRILLLLFTFCWFPVSGSKSRGFLTNDGRLSKEDSDNLKSGLTTVFYPILYSFVFVVGLLANGMAVWVFLFRTTKKYPSSIYMANLALADLLFIIWLPLKISYHVNGNNWIYGEPLCKVLVSFFYVNMYCSILFITCLSVQRYWVVAHPLSIQRKNNKIAIGVSLAIWTFVWLTSTPLYLYDHTAKIVDPDVTTCHDVLFIKNTTDVYESVKYPFYYFTFMGGVVFFIPCIVIIVAYILLLKALGNNMEESTSSKNRNKVVVLIVIVLVTFLVCFIPSNIMLVVHYAIVKQGAVKNGYGVYTLTLCLASLNSCLDPFIYYFVSDDFRDHVKNTLLCRSNRTVKRMKASFSSMKYSRKSKSYVSSSANTQSSTC